MPISLPIKIYDIKKHRRFSEKAETKNFVEVMQEVVWNITPKIKRKMRGNNYF